MSSVNGYSHTTRGKRIAVIAPLYTPHEIGGLEKAIREFVNVIKQHGHQVFVFTLAAQDGHCVVDELEEVHLLGRAGFHRMVRQHGKNDWLKFHLTEAFSTRSARRLAELLAAIKPDVIFSHGFYGFGHGIIEAIKQAGQHWVHYVHSFDVLCKRQTAVDAHGRNCERQCSSCRRLCNFKYGSQPLAAATVIFNSEYLRDYFLRSGLHTVQQRVLYPLAQLDAYDVAETIAEGDKINLVFVGRVVQSKGVDVLCEVVARNQPRFSLDVLGEGELLPLLRERYGEIVTFHGQVSSDRISPLIQRKHALVVPSILNETFGKVIYEGFLSGLPVIGAKRGAIPSLVKHGVDGFIFEWNEKNHFASLEAALTEAAKSLDQLRQGALARRAEIMRDHRPEAFLDVLLAHNA